LRVSRIRKDVLDNVPTIKKKKKGKEKKKKKKKRREGMWR
jgi:hypothetical protein